MKYTEVLLPNGRLHVVLRVAAEAVQVEARVVLIEGRVVLVKAWIVRCVPVSRKGAELPKSSRLVVPNFISALVKTEWAQGCIGED